MRAGSGISTFLGKPACAVEQVVNGALEAALEQAEALLIERLGAVPGPNWRGILTRDAAGRSKGAGRRPPFLLMTVVG